MDIKTEQKPVIINLNINDELTVSNTIVASNRYHKIDTANKKITLKVYSDFFIVITEENGKTSKEVFSDNWDFHIKGV